MVNLDHYQQSSPNHLPKYIGIALAVTTLIAGLVFWNVENQKTEQAHTLYAQAYDAFEHNNADKCNQKLNESLRLRETVPALELKFNLLTNQGNFHEGLEVIKKLVSQKPNKALYHYLASWNHEQISEYSKETLQFAKEAAQLAPNNLEYKYRLARIYAAQGDKENAVKHFEALVEADPKNRQAWIDYMSEMSLTLRDQKRALQIAERALKHHPEDFEVHFVTGKLYDLSDNGDKAAQYYRRSLELNPMKHSVAASRILELTGKPVPPELEGLVTERIPFRDHRGRMLVNVRLNDKNGEFLLDTGASYSVVYESDVKEYELTSTPYKTIADTANGPVESTICYGTLHLGKYKFPNTQILTIPDQENKSFDGIIGMSVLNRFKMEIDPENQELILKQ